VNEYNEFLRRLQIHMIGQEEGSLGISYKDKEWTVGYVFGQEAPDSDMAGAASYAVGPQLSQCLQQVVEEVGA
jgi:hypothetical protein